MKSIDGAGAKPTPSSVINQQSAHQDAAAAPQKQDHATSPSAPPASPLRPFCSIPSHSTPTILETSPLQPWVRRSRLPLPCNPSFVPAIHQADALFMPTREPSPVTATGICFFSEAMVLWLVSVVLRELLADRYDRERRRVRRWLVGLWVVAAVVLLGQAALLLE